MPTGRSAFRVGFFAGIPIGIQPLWLVIVGLITFSLGHDYFPSEDPGLGEVTAYVLALLSALLLFAGILAHELGHAIVARRRGLKVDEIDLWLLGGVSRIAGEPKAPGDELRFAIAGPLVTAAILAVLAPVRLAFGGALPAWALAMLDYQLYVTVAILVFNLLPAFPLDGGRVLRALLWGRRGDREAATAQAAAVGRGFAFVLIGIGFLALLEGQVAGLWFALIGGFLVVAGSAEEQGMRSQSVLGAYAVEGVMTPDPVTIGQDETLEQAVSTGFSRHLFTTFPVVDAEGRAVGLLSVDDIRAVPVPVRGRIHVVEVVHRDDDLIVDRGVTASELLGRPTFQRLGRAVVVDAARRPVGIVSVTDLQRRLRADALQGGGARR